MKVLLSAYACEPNRGSEQGVGWGWAIELSKSNEVWVLTRDRNQERIEKYLHSHPEYQLPSLHFIYVGVPKILTFWKKETGAFDFIIYCGRKQHTKQQSSGTGKLISIMFSTSPLFLTHSQHICTS